MPDSLAEVADQHVLLTPRQLAEIVQLAAEHAVRERPAPEAADVLLTRLELAKRMKCSAATVDRALRDGMPHVRLGDSPRFIFGDVVEWLSERARRIPRAV